MDVGRTQVMEKICSGFGAGDAGRRLVSWQTPRFRDRESAGLRGWSASGTRCALVSYIQGQAQPVIVGRGTGPFTFFANRSERLILSVP
jgi:hypothetical protein